MTQPESFNMLDERRAEFLRKRFLPVIENLTIFANLPTASPLRNRLIDPQLTTAQFKQDLVSLTQGRRKSRYAQFHSSLIDLGQALTTMEYPHGAAPQASDYKAQLLDSMQQYTLQIKMDSEQAVPIHAPLALAIHDFAIASYRTAQSEKKRKKVILYGSSLAGIALTAAFGAYKWMNRESPSPTVTPQTTPTLSGEYKPTWTAIASETLSPTPPVVIDTPVPHEISDRMNTFDLLLQKYRLNVALPNGVIPLGDPGRILDGDSLRKGKASEIQQKLFAYLEQFNMLTDGRAVYDDGVGGFTEALVRSEDSGITVTVTDGSPVKNRIIRYDPKANSCTASYEDLTGVHTDTRLLDQNDPGKLCIVSSNARKLTLIGFRINDTTGNSEVFVVITSKK